MVSSLSAVPNLKRCSKVSIGSELFLVMCESLRLSDTAKRTLGQKVDDLGFEQADDAFDQRGVIGISDAPDRSVDPDFGQSFGVFDRQILAAAIAMMNQLARF